MKKGICIVLIGCMLWGADQVYAGKIEDFVANLNSEWAAKNYTNMYQVINNRLIFHTNDLSALLLKMNYHLMVEYDLSMAQGEVSLFTNTLSVLDWSSDPFAEAICAAIVNDVVNPAEAQAYGIVYGLSSNQFESVHARFPTNHPLASLIMRIAAVQYSQ